MSQAHIKTDEKESNNSNSNLGNNTKVKPISGNTSPTVDAREVVITDSKTTQGSTTIEVSEEEGGKSGLDSPVEPQVLPGMSAEETKDEPESSSKKEKK